MFGFNSRDPLMVEIMMSIVLFSISLLVIIGTTLKVLGSIIHVIVNLTCYIIGLVENIKHKRAVKGRHQTIVKRIV